MRRAQKGITLIELMTVMVIIAVLSAIAIPSYRRYTIRANRSEAKVTLLSTAAALERCYTQFNSYKDANCPVTFPVSSTTGLYRITAATLESSKFTLNATPQKGQAADTGCGVLSLDSANVRKSSGTEPLDDCWGK